MSIACLFPQIDRTPPTLHRMYAHNVFFLERLTALRICPDFMKSIFDRRFLLARRVRNASPHAVRLRIEVSDRAARGQVLGEVDPAWQVTIRSDEDGRNVVTTQEIAGPGGTKRVFRTVDRYERPQAG